MPIFRTVVNGKVHTFENSEITLLVAEVVKFYNELNIKFDRPDLVAQINRQSKGSVFKKKTGISIKDAFQGAKALIKFTIGDSASAEEITRRARICSSGSDGSPCPLMQQTSGCSACGASRNIANAVAVIQKHKKTPISIPSEVKANYCGICECALAVMVVTKYKDFDAEDTKKNSSRPDHCWLKTTSQNFTNE